MDYLQYVTTNQYWDIFETTATVSIMISYETHDT